MTPQYSIIANGKPINDLIAPLLISLTVTDETSEQADKLSIRLDDTGGKLELPARGAEIKVSMGFGSLVELGTFLVDTVQASGPPNVLDIEAHAAPFTDGKGSKGLQTRKSRSFHKKKIGEIVRSVAGEHGLSPVIDEELASIDPDHIDQTEESDSSFLARLARDCGAALKISAGKLAFIKRGGSRTASGKPMDSVKLTLGEVSTWSCVFADKDAFKSASATYRDVGKAETKELIIGGGEPTLKLPHVYSTKGNAKRAAKARLEDAKRGSGGKFSCTMSARLDIVAETPLELSGFRSGVDGEFVVRRISHTLDRSGLKSQIDAEKPGSRDSEDTSSGSTGGGDDEEPDDDEENEDGEPDIMPED